MPSTYKTKQGDTWDLIAYQTVGSELHMIELLEANPQHKETVIFSAGVVLNIPTIRTPEPDTLPPWKRGENS